MEAGEHTVAAWFRCAPPVTGDLVGEVRVIAWARQHLLTAGRDWVALCGIHADATRESHGWIERIAADVFLVSNSYRAMEIVDPDDIRSRFAGTDRDGRPR